MRPLHNGFCRPAQHAAISRRLARELESMQDVLMITFTIAFFAAAFLYVKALEKLR
ncbi:MAG TPA: hypothetical protein VGR64_05485 [Terracidiphilus sp.]|nr:hypothetical protein [Terracidiphilus sp.]